MPAGDVAPMGVVTAGRGARWAWCPKAVVHAGGDAPLAVVPAGSGALAGSGASMAVVHRWR